MKFVSLQKLLLFVCTLNQAAEILHIVILNNQRILRVHRLDKRHLGIMILRVHQQPNDGNCIPRIISRFHIRLWLLDRLFLLVLLFLFVFLLLLIGFFGFLNIVCARWLGLVTSFGRMFFGCLKFILVCLGTVLGCLLRVSFGVLDIFLGIFFLLVLWTSLSSSPWPPLSFFS